MHTPRAFILALLVLQVTSAQTSEAALRSRIVDVHYPPLGEQARIQGDVRLTLNSGVATVVSGHPLLSPVAAGSAKVLASGTADADLIYHFVLVGTLESRKPVTVHKGNAFERAVLRLFGLKTEKVVLEYQCQENLPPPNDLKVSGATIDIWVFGRVRCLQTQTTQLLAQS